MSKASFPHGNIVKPALEIGHPSREGTAFQHTLIRRLRKIMLICLHFISGIHFEGDGG